jgi:DNA-binding NarL/FixJ family response regulator
MTKLLIADDHPVVRQGLRRMVEDSPGLSVVAEASDGDATVLEVADRQDQLRATLTGYALSVTLP